jgi:hypothetical protein
MNTAFLDLEFGQVYGSYRTNFIPIEIGVVISGSEDGVPVLLSKKFHFDIDLVLRKNITDQVGKKIDVEERVVNTGRKEYQKRFDPSYRLPKTDKKAIRKLSDQTFIELREYIQTQFNQYHVTQIVLFGGREDLKLLSKANVKISEFVDIQSVIQKEIHYPFSLDKISRIISFYKNNEFYGSQNFQYPMLKRYKHLIKPHRAIGDACRIFMAYKEFYGFKPEFVQQCRNYLDDNENDNFIVKALGYSV